MARTPKPTHDLLLPAATGWTRWTGTPAGGCLRVAEFGQSAGVFGKEVQHRVLALPAAHVWVLPAWLNGESAHLRDMAGLHLERLGVRVTDIEHGLQTLRLSEKDGAHLTCILALKDMPSPLWDMSRLPDEIVLAAACHALPADSIVILRELGRLVVAITHGTQLVYASALSAHRLDDHALSELNNICIQLGFQRVLGRIESIVLWLEGEGDLGQVERVTGLSARREPMPAPRLPAKGTSTLTPADIRSARAKQQAAARTRLVALSVGFAVAACVAMMSVLTTFAMQERSLLREKVAALSPQASQVLDQKKSWIEAAPAVDPTTFPMQVLLDCMKPAASTEVSMTNFEWAPDRLILSGRTQTPALALQYAKEITEVEALTRFTWETPAPTIASDNSATFELKGGITP